MILVPLTVISIALRINENVVRTIKTSISPSHFSPTLAKPTWAIQLTDVITIRTLQKEVFSLVTVLKNYKWQVTAKLNLKDLSSSFSIRICFRRRRRKNDWDKCIFYLYAYVPRRSFCKIYDFENARFTFAFELNHNDLKKNDLKSLKIRNAIELVYGRFLNLRILSSCLLLK